MQTRIAGKTTGFGLMLAVAPFVAVPAWAQSATTGPLASPEAAVVQPAHPKAARHRKPARHAAHETSATAPVAADRPEAQPIAHAPAADPLSFGMKWNGSNDDARATRVQNYDGSAAGTGAEVGLKLHF